MTDASTDLRGALLVVLDEAIEGARGTSTFFVDNEPGRGLRGTVDRLTAEQASSDVDGRSVASHLAHVAFAMEASAAWIAGSGGPVDWGTSWEPARVDEAGWAAARERADVAWEALREAIATADLTGDAAPEAVGAVAHVAYHLGVLRHKIRRFTT